MDPFTGVLIFMLLVVFTIFGILAQRHGEQIGEERGIASERERIRRQESLENDLEELGQRLQELEVELDSFEAGWPTSPERAALREELADLRDEIEDSLYGGAPIQVLDLETKIDELDDAIQELDDDAFLDLDADSTEAELLPSIEKPVQASPESELHKNRDQVRVINEVAVDDGQRDTERPWDNPPLCATCGSANVAWVMQGLPAFDDDELMLAKREGRVIFGGCCRGNHWKCRDCDNLMFQKFNRKGQIGSTIEDEALSKAAERESSSLDTPTRAYARLKSLVDDVKPDLENAERGNGAAGIRVRKAMQDVKLAAQEVRVVVLEARGPRTK